MFDFIIHNGDLAYNLDSNAGVTGTEFLTNIEAASATTPYVVTAGNHEFMGTSETYYKNWFLGQTKLGTSSGSANPIMYYSFDVGTKLHVAVISTEVYCEDTANIIPQHQWLAKDLAAVRARTVQPWILVFGHRQMYIGSGSYLHARLMRLGLQCNDSTLQHCDYTKSCDSKKDCGYSIEQLFTQYKVDMYFAGHVHTYNRMFPISADLTFEAQDADKYSNPQHPVYVVSGAAGTQSSPTSDFMSGSPLASPTAKAVTGYSFSLVTVHNDTHLELEQNDITTGDIVDTFWIVKDKSLPPWSKTTALTLDADTQTICDQ
jgi:3',5'-cyclic AMP phosphodiesterase CpdA